MSTAIIAICTRPGKPLDLPDTRPADPLAFDLDAIDLLDFGDPLIRGRIQRAAYQQGIGALFFSHLSGRGRAAR